MSSGHKLPPLSFPSLTLPSADESARMWRAQRRKQLAVAVVAFVVGCGIQWLIVSDAAHASPAPCRWRVKRDRVTVSGGSLAFLAVEDGEPFAAEYMGSTTGGEQWAVLTRTCER